MMYRAVVKYATDATRKEKIAALRDGLGTITTELVDLGLTLQAVEDALDEAMNQAIDEADAISDDAPA
jgi:late competence protein required for DNA uptake (superfamily II DNA/RNA helicase)